MAVLVFGGLVAIAVSIWPSLSIAVVIFWWLTTTTVIASLALVVERERGVKDYVCRLWAAYDLVKNL